MFENSFKGLKHLFLQFIVIWFVSKRNFNNWSINFINCF